MVIDEPTNPAEPNRRASWRDWMRSYLLAGRIAAGIVQSQPEGRLPEAFALTRVHRANQPGLDAAERVGKIVLTLPLDFVATGVREDEGPRNGSEFEDPFSLPRLHGRG